MGSAEMTWNVHLSHVTTIVVCVLCVLLPFTSAYTSSESEVPAFDDFSKRDIYMGLELQCRSHPRNCPDGIIFEKRLRDRQRDFDLNRAKKLLQAGQGLQNTYNSLREGVGLRLLDLLKQVPYHAEKSDGEW